MTNFRRILEVACLTGSELELQAPFNSPSGGRIAPPQPSPKGRERLSFGQLGKRHYNLHYANIPSFGGLGGA